MWKGGNGKKRKKKRGCLMEKVKGQLMFEGWQEKHQASSDWYERQWAKASVLLHHQAARRAARHQARAIEANIQRAAGSFERFGHQLRRENSRLFAEMVAMQAWHLELVKALSSGQRLADLRLTLWKPGKEGK